MSSRNILVDLLDWNVLADLFGWTIQRRIAMGQLRITLFEQVL